MDDQPTCGKGLAENAELPAALGDLMASMARILEVHMEALDLTDQNALKEHEAYSVLTKDLGNIAAALATTARQMKGYRDLPTGKHDEKIMAGRKAFGAFEKFVELEGALLRLLQRRQEQNREMVLQMSELRGEGI